MPITERTLRKWRKEALESRERLFLSTIFADGGKESKLEWAGRILRLTQELLDQHMLRK